MSLLQFGISKFNIIPVLISLNILVQFYTGRCMTRFDYGGNDCSQIKGGLVLQFENASPYFNHS